MAELAELAVLPAAKNLTAIIITSLAGKPHGQGLSAKLAIFWNWKCQSGYTFCS